MTVAKVGGWVGPITNAMSTTVKPKLNTATSGQTMRGNSCGNSTRSQTERTPCPKLRATFICPANCSFRSSRFKKLANTKTRNGVSFSTSAAMSERP